MAYFQPAFTNGTKQTPLLSVADYFTGYKLTIAGGTVFTLDPGCVRALTVDTPISYTGQDPTLPSRMIVDITTVGELGCYPLPFSAIAVDTALPVYVLGDSTGANGATAIIATGNNFLIPGYDVWRRVGTVYADASLNELMNLVQTGNGVNRRYAIQESIPATNSADTALNQLDFAGPAYPCNPALLSSLSLNVAYTPAALVDQLNMTSSNFTPSVFPIVIKSPVAGQAVSSVVEIAPSIAGGSASVYFANSAVGGLAAIALAGWEESYGLNAV